MLTIPEILQWTFTLIGALASFLGVIIIYMIKDFKERTEKKNDEIANNQDNQKLILTEVRKDIHIITKTNEELKTRTYEHTKKINDINVQVAVLQTWKKGVENEKS